MADRSGGGTGASGASGAAGVAVERLRLSRSSDHRGVASTALLRLRPGNAQPTRLDSGGGGFHADRDSGHRLTAMFFLPPDRKKKAEKRNNADATSQEQEGGPDYGGHLLLQPYKGGEGADEGQNSGREGAVTVEAKANRLVVWRSDQVTNARTQNKEGNGGGEDNDDGGDDDDDDTADLYAIQFWMHGIYIGENNNGNEEAAA